MSVFENKTGEFIRRYNMLSGCTGIIIALSGGSDSVSLLHYLYNNAGGMNLYAAHLNHMIRGEEAERDEWFVRGLCAGYGTECFVGKINVPEISKKNGRSLEETARLERYKFFSEVCAALDKGGGIKVATAHTASDNAESVLFNILRGSGLNGLTGITPVSGNVIRPMLLCTKNDVMAYVDEHGLSRIEDSTNNDTAYTRNFLRHDVLSRFGNAAENVIRLSELVSVDSDYIDGEVDRVIKENGITDSIDIDLLLSLHKALSARILQRIYGCVTEQPHYTNGLEYRHIVYILDAARNFRRNKKMNLPNAVEAKIAYDRLILQKVKSLEDYDIKLDYGENYIKEINSVINLKKTGFDIKMFENINTLFNNVQIDNDKIKGSIFARRKRDGDCYIFNHQNKSVKKNYINQKIDVDLRRRLPVFYDDDGIFWACGLPVADRVRPLKETKNFLNIRIEQK